MTARWPGLVRLAYGLTGDRWLAEDVAQAALASAYAAWWRVRRADDPDAYVRRILINTSHRRFRRHRVAEQAHQPGELPDAAVADPAELIGQRSRAAGRGARAARPAARGRAAPVLGRPERRAGGGHPRLLAGHGAQPGIPGPGQAARQRRAGRPRRNSVTSPDEQLLRQRLRHDLSTLPAAAPPVAAVVRRGTRLARPALGDRRRRGWPRWPRWPCPSSGAGAAHGQPAGRLSPRCPRQPGHRPRPAHRTGADRDRIRRGHGGQAGPGSCRSRNIADPAARCLPAHHC